MLLAVAHGTASARGRADIEALVAHVRKRRPELETTLAWLDHAHPRLEEVDSRGAVVVPLLLSTGYHVTRDIPARARDALVADALGPHPLLSTALADRLAQAGAPPDAPIRLAGAGSPDALQAAAALLAEHLDKEVTVGPASGRIAVATYLLGAGRFADDIANCGARWVSAPLARHPALAELVLLRHDERASHGG